MQGEKSAKKARKGLKIVEKKRQKFTEKWQDWPKNGEIPRKKQTSIK